MLFLVISESLPRAALIEVVTQRKRLLGLGCAVAGLRRGPSSTSPKADEVRQSCSTVPSNERLHQRLNEWAGIIPARFAVHALIDPDAALAFLGKSGTAEV